MTRQHDLPTNDRRTTWLALHLYGAILLGTFAGASSLQLVKREEHPEDTFAADKAGPNLSSHNNFPNFLNSTSDSCRIDRSQPPVLDELIGCKNSSLFHLWRSKARVTGPRGWMNDPMAICSSKLSRPSITAVN
jgi:hypothetical protein